MLQKAFAIGNSVAVTIPSRVGMLPGTRLRYVPTRGNRLAYDVVEEPAKKVKKKMSKQEIERYVKSHTGNLKLDISTEEFMKIKAYCREHPYEKI
jgi:hypothetical protein